MISGIGTDLVEVLRMQKILAEERGQFMDNTFSALEQEYCSSYADAAVHFAGTFAAKEAVRKANGMYLKFNEIEIRRTSEGKPEVWIQGRRDEKVLVSISHTETLASAVAIAQ